MLKDSAAHATARLPRHKHSHPPVGLWPWLVPVCTIARQSVLPAICSKQRHLHGTNRNTTAGCKATRTVQFARQLQPA